MDRLLEDDECDINGLGVSQMMSGLQGGFDLLFNQFLFAATQSNNPIAFFTPTGNKKPGETKMKAGYMYPSADASGVNFQNFQGPNESLKTMMEEIRNFSQLLFGISDYASGIESSIDPTAPAKKAEIVVSQGNKRMGLVIRRKNQTLKDIFKKWFLLYQANMPESKVMRITGNVSDKWEFQDITMDDFALSGIPDFELTGNILTSNKQLQANKAIAIYSQLSGNFLFDPKSPQGLPAYYALTKWFLNELDAVGVADFLPKMATMSSHTPGEENAMFLMGDNVEPEENDDHLRHNRVHNELIDDVRTPPEVRASVIKHVIKHTDMLKQALKEKIIAERAGMGAMPTPGGASGPALMPPRAMGMPAPMPAPMPMSGGGMRQIVGGE
jgi:hypothetical protein